MPVCDEGADGVDKAVVAGVIKDVASGTAAAERMVSILIMPVGPMIVWRLRPVSPSRAKSWQSSPVTTPFPGWPASSHPGTDVHANEPQGVPSGWPGVAPPRGKGGAMAD